MDPSISTKRFQNFAHQPCSRCTTYMQAARIRRGQTRPATVPSGAGLDPAPVVRGPPTKRCAGTLEGVCPRHCSPSAPHAPPAPTQLQVPPQQVAPARGIGGGQSAAAARVRSCAGGVGTGASAGQGSRKGSMQVARRQDSCPRRACGRALPRGQGPGVVVAKGEREVLKLRQ